MSAQNNNNNNIQFQFLSFEDNNSTQENEAQNALDISRERSDSLDLGAALTIKKTTAFSMIEDDDDEDDNNTF